MALTKIWFKVVDVVERGNFPGSPSRGYQRLTYLDNSPTADAVLPFPSPEFPDVIMPRATLVHSFDSAKDKFDGADNTDSPEDRRSSFLTPNGVLAANEGLRWSVWTFVYESTDYPWFSWTLSQFPNLHDSYVEDFETRIIDEVF